MATRTHPCRLAVWPRNPIPRQQAGNRSRDCHAECVGQHAARDRERRRSAPKARRPARKPKSTATLAVYGALRATPQGPIHSV
eukprot:4406397-Alexandrium_andersonii.AAC.1